MEKHSFIHSYIAPPQDTTTQRHPFYGCCSLDRSWISGPSTEPLFSSTDYLDYTCNKV